MSLVSVRRVADAECECSEAGERAWRLLVVRGERENEGPVEAQLAGLIQRGVPMRVEDSDAQISQSGYPVLYKVWDGLCQGR